jgi:hypothetical protein
MFTRRIGEACDAAQNMPVFRQSVVPPLTLTVRFDSERQKLFKAKHLSTVMQRL